MGKVLKFKKMPELNDLEGLSVNSSKFEIGEGIFQKGVEVPVMSIPNTFRFSTTLEVAENKDGSYVLVMTQFLTRGPEYWEMEEAFDRIGFRNPEIEEQMRALCNSIIERGLAVWEEQDY